MDLRDQIPIKISMKITMKNSLRLFTESISRPCLFSLACLEYLTYFIGYGSKIGKALDGFKRMKTEYEWNVRWEMIKFGFPISTILVNVSRLRQ